MKLLMTCIFIIGWALASVAFADDGTRYKSDFDILLERLGQTNGQIPFPPSEIVNRLQGPEKYTLARTIVPHGMAPHARHTDYHNPRTIISWTANTFDTQQTSGSMSTYQLLSFLRTTAVPAMGSIRISLHIFRSPTSKSWHITTDASANLFLICSS